MRTKVKITKGEYNLMDGLLVFPSENLESELGRAYSGYVELTDEDLDALIGELAGICNQDDLSDAFQKRSRKLLDKLADMQESDMWF